MSDDIQIMLREIRRRTEHGESFAFETTLSGRTYLRRIHQWQTQGYSVKLIFLSLPSLELAIARVVARVAQGGHWVTDDVVRRRFERSNPRSGSKEKERTRS